MKSPTCPDYPGRGLETTVSHVPGRGRCHSAVWCSAASFHPHSDQLACSCSVDLAGSVDLDLGLVDLGLVDLAGSVDLGLGLVALGLVALGLAGLAGPDPAGDSFGLS